MPPVTIANINPGYCKMKKWPVWAVYSIILFLGACDKDHHQHPQLSTPKQLFDYHCAGCHRQDGLGTFLKGVPANIATDKNHPEIVWHITRGSDAPSARMPVFRDMPTEEANKIAHHLLSLKRQYDSAPENRDKFLLKRQQ